jgi:anti-sigma factor RsiW
MTESLSFECRTVLSRISTYLDGELDRAACDLIEAHCHACADCATVVSDLRKTVGLCRDVAHAPLPDVVRQRARDRVKALLDSAAPRR